MKKFYFIAAMAATMTLASCGFGQMGQTTQTNTAGNLLGAALTGQQGSSTNLLGAVLNQLVQVPTTQATLEGTWTYTAPKVIFESDNMLAQLGSAVASSKIESTLSTYLAKIGMTAGKSKFTFNHDNTCVFELNGRQTQGTYTYDTATKQLTLTGAFGMASLTCIATVNAGELDMVFDASKLLNVASAVSGAGSTGKTLSTLLANYNGLKLGWAMRK